MRRTCALRRSALHALHQPPARTYPPVYLCICNALTDRQVAQAVAGSATRPTEIYEACGCRAQCGACVKTLLGLLREKAQADDALCQGAD